MVKLVTGRLAELQAEFEEEALELQMCTVF